MSLKEIPLVCLSVTQAQASPEERARFALPKERQGAFLKELIKAPAAVGAVLLCTCNRTEVYVCAGADPKSDFAPQSLYEAAETVLADFTGAAVRQIHRFFMYYAGRRALRHLLKVAAGLDSVNLGENEILGQLEEAYAQAGAAGTCGSLLNQVFQQAVCLGRSLRQQSGFGGNALSYATLTANEIGAFAREYLMGGPVKVLMIGAAGQLGLPVLKTLLNRPGISVTATQRKKRIGIEAPNLKIIDYEDRYPCVAECGVIFSATACPRYTLTYEETLPFIKGPKLFLDLALGRDIDADLGKLPGCRLRDYPYFENLIRDHLGQRRAGASKALLKLDDCADEILCRLKINRFARAHEGLPRALAGKSAQNLFYALQKHADPGELDVLYGLLEKSEIFP